MRAWGRLLRLSLSPTALADIAAGILLGAGRWPSGSEPWILMLASLCVYHGGMVLNDWADRDHDREVRPDRPIPSGRVPADLALVLGLLLLAAGPLVALAAHRASAIVLAYVALAAYVYDLFGRGPISGPALLGSCRAGNLATGWVYGSFVAIGTRAHEASALACIALYGAYVFFVSRLGRLEDAAALAPDDRRPSAYLSTAAAAMLVLPILPAHHAARAALAGEATAATAPSVWGACALAVAGAWGLFRIALATQRWTKGSILAAMGASLRRLLVFTAVIALVSSPTHGWIAALAILAGYPLSFVLRGWFPPS